MNIHQTLQAELLLLKRMHLKWPYTWHNARETLVYRVIKLNLCSEMGDYQMTRKQGVGGG